MFFMLLHKTNSAYIKLRLFDFGPVSRVTILVNKHMLTVESTYNLSLSSFLNEKL